METDIIYVCIYIYIHILQMDYINVFYTHYLHLYTSIYVIVHLYTSWYIYIRHYTSLYITIHQYTSLYNTIHQYTSLYNIIHQYTSLHITLHQYTSWYIIRHHYTSIYIMTHHYTSIYIYDMYHMKTRLSGGTTGWILENRVTLRPWPRWAHDKIILVRVWRCGEMYTPPYGD